MGHLLGAYMAVSGAGRFYGVEVLRFMAAAMVVFTHSTFYAHERNDPAVLVWHFGEAGVDIFFVISGFVIVIASRRSGDWVSAGYFASRRFLRIIPMYWLATSLNIAILIAMPSLVLHSGLDWGQIARSYLLIPDVNSDGRIEPLLGVAWTLYFETFFYVVFGLALLLRVSPFAFVPAVLAVFVAMSFFKTADWPALAVYANPIVLEFLAGMAIAANIQRLQVGRAAAYSLLLGGAVLLLVLGEVHGELPPIIYRGLPSVLIVAGMVAAEKFIDWSRLGWLIYLGGASYAIYLFHPLIGPVGPVVVSRLGITNGALSILLSLLLAISIPTALHAVIERPLMRIFSPKKKPQAAPAE